MNIRKGQVWRVFTLCVVATPVIALSTSAQITRSTAQVKNQKQKVPSPTPSPNEGITTWPVAPQSPPKFLETMRPQYTQYLPYLLFEGPLSQLPPDRYNLLREITSSSMIRGTLLYPTDFYKKFFIMRGINTNGLIEGQPSNIATYPLQAFDTMFEPQFSPDGKRILFKIGDPFESTGTYSLFLWDTVATQVRPASREYIDALESKLFVADAFGQPAAGQPQNVMYGERITFRKTFWSPNSRWVAYVRGGDKGGRVRARMMYPQLRLLDVTTGRSRRVVRNFGAVDEMAWTSRNTLLFVMLPKDKLPPQQEQAENQATDPEPEEPQKPSIFEAVTGRGVKPRLVITNAERPMPSPDNRWIAFARPKADPNNPTQELCLFDRQSGVVKTLETQKISFMLWTPDSRKLVVTKAFYHGENDGRGRGEAQISVFDIQSGAQRDVAQLTAYDYRPISGSEQNGQFRILKLSRDGHFLFVHVAEITGPSVEYSAEKQGVISLLAVNLADGEVTRVARFDSPGPAIMGLDWHDETGTATTATSSNTTATKKR